MREFKVLSGVCIALLASGCAGNRREAGLMGGTSEMFSVRKDPISTGEVITYSDTSLATAGDPKTMDGVLWYEVDRYYTEMARARVSQRTFDSTGVAPATYSADLTRFRAAGWDAARSLCGRALQLMGESQARYRFGNRSVQLGSGFIGTMMGLSKSSAQSMSVFAASNSLFTAWSQTFEDYAFMTPSNQRLTELVSNAQDTFRRAKEEAGAPLSWSDANDQIQKYNRYCLATGLRELVDQAVSSASLVYANDGVEVVGAGTIRNLKVQTDFRDYLHFDAVRLEKQDTLDRLKIEFSTRATRIKDLEAREVTLAGAATVEGSLSAANDAVTAANSAAAANSADPALDALAASAVARRDLLKREQEEGKKTLFRLKAEQSAQESQIARLETEVASLTSKVAALGQQIAPSKPAPAENSQDPD